MEFLSLVLLLARRLIFGQVTSLSCASGFLSWRWRNISSISLLESYRLHTPSENYLILLLLLFKKRKSDVPYLSLVLYSLHAGTSVLLELSAGGLIDFKQGEQTIQLEYPFYTKKYTDCFYFKLCKALRYQREVPFGVLHESEVVLLETRSRCARNLLMQYSGSQLFQI